MEILNFDNQTFRCSSLGKLMSNPKGGSNKEKYETAKSELDEIKKKAEEKISAVQVKIDAFAQEKREQAGFKKLEEQKLKYVSQLTDKVIELRPTLDELEKFKDVVTLSETCISTLIAIYIEQKTGRKRDLVNRYVKKGNEAEDDSISLLSSVDNEFYIKNTERKNNGFIEGECDIDAETYIVDTKSSWDAYTFYTKVREAINPDYELQGQGYMELWGREKFVLAYILSNTPNGIIEDEKRSLLWKMGSNKKETIAYEQGCEEIMFNNVFDDIPVQERVVKFELERDAERMKEVYDRIPHWREWLNSYAKSEWERAYENNGVVKQKVKEDDIHQNTKIDKGIISEENLTEKNNTVVEETKVSVSEKSEDIKEQPTTPASTEFEVEDEATEFELTQFKENVFTEPIATILQESKLVETKKEVQVQKSEDVVEEAPVKENNSNSNQLLDKIESLESMQGVLDFYEEHKATITDEEKTALGLKRDSLKPKAAAAPAPKSATPPKPSTHPIAPVQQQEKSAEEISLKTKLDAAKTPQEVKDIAGVFMDLIKSRPDLRKYASEAGVRCTNNALPPASDL